jgi:hypothetical protein
MKKKMKKTELKRKTPLRSTPFKRKPAKEKSKFEISEIKTKLKPLEDKRKHTDELDKVFQFYIRLRDSRSDGRCQCISCGRIVPFDKIQAGHYRSRKNMSTRWSELNVNAECFVCNCMEGDHLINYRKNLIKKIGEQKVNWLDAYCNEAYKWSDFELVIMIKDYCKKCLSLSKEKGIPLSTTVQRIIKKYKITL